MPRGNLLTSGRDRQSRVVAQLLGDGDEVAEQQFAGSGGDLRRQLGRGDVDGPRHVRQPGLAFWLADLEPQVAHPQPRVATLLGVRGRATPVLDQEQREPPPRSGEIRCLGVQRQQHLARGDAVVEPVDEQLEERRATNALVQLGRLHRRDGTVATMADRPSIVPADICAYIAAHAAAPDDVLEDLRRRTAQLGSVAVMQVSAEEGALLTLLTELVGVTSAIEVGTFTGFSSICIARGLAPGGSMLCCDVSEEYTAIARDAWRAAGLDDRIEL